MNLFIKLLFLLNIILTADLFSQECKAQIFIGSDIENVNIFVDDSLAGSGKNIDLYLKKGTYKISAVEISNKWDAIIFSDTLLIKDCSDIKLQYNFTDKVLLNTQPQDVYVFSNDSLIGYTPLLIPLGMNNIKLEKPGFASKSVDYSDFGSNRPVRLSYVGEIDNGIFFDKTLFKILVGSMLVLGVATAYLKLKADNKFDQYQMTGDEALLDQTNRLDTMSAVTFVALQINFGYIIYRFLVD